MQHSELVKMLNQRPELLESLRSQQGHASHEQPEWLERLHAQQDHSSQQDHVYDQGHANPADSAATKTDRSRGLGQSQSALSQQGNVTTLDTAASTPWPRGHVTPLDTAAPLTQSNSTVASSASTQKLSGDSNRMGPSQAAENGTHSNGAKAGNGDFGRPSDPRSSLTSYPRSSLTSDPRSSLTSTVLLSSSPSRRLSMGTGGGSPHVAARSGGPELNLEPLACQGGGAGGPGPQISHGDRRGWPSVPHLPASPRHPLLLHQAAAYCSSPTNPGVVTGSRSEVGSEGGTAPGLSPARADKKRILTPESPGRVDRSDAWAIAPAWGGSPGRHKSSQGGGGTWASDRPWTGDRPSPLSGISGAAYKEVGGGTYQSHHVWHDVSVDMSLATLGHPATGHPLRGDC